MSNRTLLAAELARRIPALQADCRTNNEAMIAGLIEQYLGPDVPPKHPFIKIFEKGLADDLHLMTSKPFEALVVR